MTDPGPSSLAELEARLARDLDLLILPAPEWSPPHGDLLDVAIVGAGMAGLTAAFALQRLGIRNIRLFDRAPEGLEGPWATYARMETLRSPKHLVGPALGFANLTFRAWFEAQFGAAAWERLGKIPRLQWLDYLRWYRTVLKLPVENGVALTGLSGTQDGVVLSLRRQGVETRVAARRVVLANGRDGLGGPYVPELWRGVDRRFWRHAHEDIDFAALRGKSVAVIGGGAGATDNAASALEAGAAHAAMLLRRAEVPRVNKSLGISNPGLALGFHGLSDARRWEQTQYVADCAIPAPRDSMLRCSRHPNFELRTAVAIEAVRTEGGRVVLETVRGDLAYDFMVLATGFTVDWAQRPELAALADTALLWRDRTVPPGWEEHQFADHPYLGPAFEFVERTPGAAPWIGRVHAFNYAATLSHGKVTGDIPAISFGAERLAEGIVTRFYEEDYAVHHQRLLDFATPELHGDEWTVAAEAAA